MIISLRRQHLRLKTVILQAVLFLLIFPTFCLSRTQKATNNILIFAPHPDDETACCAGTILKAIQDNKKVKIIFLTNGDGDSNALSVWLEKTPEELTPADFIAFGEMRQEEALQAASKLGLDRQDIVFLSYPDSGLASLWEAGYTVNYKSETTDKATSAYKKTYNRARQGHTKENLLSDLKDVLKEYRPQRIYTPHPLDRHRDHEATTHFVNLALAELVIEEGNRQANSIDISYYLTHNYSDNWPDPNLSVLKSPTIFSQPQSRSEDISYFKNQKKEALKAYRSQLSIEKNKNFLEGFIKDNELFWDVPNDKSAYLRGLQKEWLGIAKVMKQEGYNVNLAPVVDVADNIEDMSIQLIKRQRMYSHDPYIISELAYAVIRGLSRGRIIPVLKHFPGLGSIHTDTHFRLPLAGVSKIELAKDDLIPFRNLIEKQDNIWIMVDHAIYPDLSTLPASLSYEIQTDLLREKLGFQGIIIVDELLNMQAISEFAYQEKIKEPYIGEIITRAFKAGADIALIYPSPEKAEEIVAQVIQSLKQAVEQGRLKEKLIDDSVKRILKVKEDIFTRPLRHLFRGMSLEEKICQKLTLDTYKDTEIFKRYNLGGIRARDYTLIQGLQKSAKIPMFVIAEHEGGLVNEYLLKLYTRSAYVIGREFERLVIKAGGKVALPSTQEQRTFNNKLKTGLPDFNQLEGASGKEIISCVLDSLDQLIGLWSEIKLSGNAIPHPNFLSPITIYPDGKFQIKAYQELPIEWLKRFPNQEMNLEVYQWFRKAFQDWSANLTPVIGIDAIITQLESFKEYIKGLSVKEDKSWIRILCVAAHPDDEDGEALAYFQRKFNCSTYILLATRGEEGENKLDSSSNEELGSLRTQEMHNAALILGVKNVYYLGKRDFGYCPDTEEAFRQWDKQDTLKRIVYFYRLIKPHIIITKHHKQKLYPHESGQHQALAVLAEEAFDLAGNPQIYPEMIKQGLSVWQPLKFYQRIKQDSANQDNVVAIEAKERIMPEDKTIHQIYLEALAEHRSQGDWQGVRLAASGKAFYQLVKSKLSQQVGTSFFAGIQLE